MFRSHPDHLFRLWLRAVVPGLIVLSLLVSLGVAAAQGGTRHTVRAGETLGSIARQYGVSVTALAAANGIANPDLIYAGQTLVIPSGSGGGGAGGGAPTSYAGGIYGVASTPNAYLDSTATQRIGVIPRGTPFTALARSGRSGSNMMLVQGEGFVVWVAWPWTSLSEAQYESLPAADEVYLPQLLCVVAFCQQFIVGGNPIGGPVRSVGSGGVSSPVGGTGVLLGPPLTAPGGSLTRVDNANLHILFNQDNVAEGWAEFRLQLCAAPNSYAGCEPVLRLYEFGQLVQPLRVENGYPVWRLGYHLHSTARLESAHYTTEQLWVSHPYDDRSAP